MPRVKKLDLGMTALDELFMNDKERAENKLPKIFDIPLSEIDDFPDHPYRVLDDEDMAKSHADMLVQLITPDLKCMAYYSSNSGMFELGAENRIKVMNISDKDLFLPITEVANHFKGVDFTLPFSKALKQQTITGTLSERLPDAKYRSVAAGIAKAVI